MADSTKHSLCWDCGKSTRSGCCWAENFEPVDGWTVERTENSYRVLDCPEFERDSYDFGLFRNESDYLKLLEKRRRKWK